MIIYSHRSANPANLTKIDPVDFEILVLTEIVEKETEAATGRAIVSNAESLQNGRKSTTSPRVVHGLGWVRSTAAKVLKI